MKENLYSEALYEDIGEWFEENGVNYERTCTGVNMLSNILAYVRGKGFLPSRKNSKTIFLEKDLSQEVEKGALRKAYELYCINRKRSEHKDMTSIMEEIDETGEFSRLTEEQKNGLAQSFLKEDEKSFDIPPEKMKLVYKFMEELKKVGINATIEDIPKLIGSNDENIEKAKRKVLTGKKDIVDDEAQNERVPRKNQEGREDEER